MSFSATPSAIASSKLTKNIGFSQTLKFSDSLTFQSSPALMSTLPLSFSSGINLTSKIASSFRHSSSNVFPVTDSFSGSLAFESSPQIGSSNPHEKTSDFSDSVTLVSDHPSATEGSAQPLSAITVDGAPLATHVATDSPMKTGLPVTTALPAQTVYVEGSPLATEWPASSHYPMSTLFPKSSDPNETTSNAFGLTAMERELLVTTVLSVPIGHVDGSSLGTDWSPSARSFSVRFSSYTDLLVANKSRSATEVVITTTPESRESRFHSAKGSRGSGEPGKEAVGDNDDGLPFLVVAVVLIVVLCCVYSALVYKENENKKKKIMKRQ
jgi:hypothetical protein